MDLPGLHIWILDAPVAVMAILDDQGRSRLPSLQSPPSSSTLQGQHKAFQLDSRQDWSSYKSLVLWEPREYTLAVGIQSFQHRTSNFSTRLPCQRDDKRGTRSHSQDEAPAQFHQPRQACWRWELDEDRRNVVRNENVADANESLTQMCEHGNMKNRLRGKMMQLDSPKF